MPAPGALPGQQWPRRSSTGMCGGSSSPPPGAERMVARSRKSLRPLLERRRHDAELARVARDVCVVADVAEPLQHDRQVLAVLPDLLDRDLHEVDRPAERLAEDTGYRRHR